MVVLDFKIKAIRVMNAILSLFFPYLDLAKTHMTQSQDLPCGYSKGIALHSPTPQTHGTAPQ